MACPGSSLGGHGVRIQRRCGHGRLGTGRVRSDQCDGGRQDEQFGQADTDQMGGVSRTRSRRARRSGTPRRWRPGAPASATTRPKAARPDQALGARARQARVTRRQHSPGKSGSQAERPAAWPPAAARPPERRRRAAPAATGGARPAGRPGGTRPGPRPGLGQAGHRTPTRVRRLEGTGELRMQRAGQVGDDSQHRDDPGGAVMPEDQRHEGQDPGGREAQQRWATTCRHVPDAR